MKKSINLILTLLVPVTLLVMTGCEKHCEVKLKNGTTGEIIILTKITDGNGQEVENSASLKAGEELTIGDCVDCTALDDNEIKPEKMLVRVGAAELELKSKQEILKFLTELRSVECGVKIFE